MLLSGIFAPEKTGGLSAYHLIADQEKKERMHFDIVSLYVSWGDQQQCFLPFKLLDSVYQNNSIPMITWEPWQNLFVKTNKYGSEEKDKNVFLRIKDGAYDAYIDQFSKQIKSLNRPVYLRFAHEADNPSYPWSQTGFNTAEEFKDAWKYVHDYFNRNNVINVIWVWNPWHPEAIDDYFPGSNYVDWIGCRKSIRWYYSD